MKRSRADVVISQLSDKIKLLEDTGVLILKDSFSLSPEAGKPYWRHVLYACFGDNKEIISFGGVDSDRSVALVKSVMELFEIISQFGDQSISSTGWAAGFQTMHLIELD